MWHDSRIRETWFVYMWPCLYVEFVTHLYRDSFLVMSYINMSYKVTSPGDLSKRCSHVTHSTQHMNESRTLYDIWTSHELHISMGHELPCSSLLALQSCHALHTTYEWVTNSTQHTNESRIPCINDYEWVTNFTWQMNESHTPLVSLIHELSYPDVPKRTHPFHALQIKYESVTNSTYKRVTNYMQLPQRLHSGHKLHTWISHEIHMYTSHELHAAP